MPTHNRTSSVSTSQIDYTKKGGFMPQDANDPTTVIFDVKTNIVFDMPRLNAELEKRGEQGFFDKLSGTAQRLIEDPVNAHAEALSLVDRPIGDLHEFSAEMSVTLADGDKATCALTLSTNLAPDLAHKKLLSKLTQVVVNYLLVVLDDPFDDKKYAEDVSHLAGHLRVSDDAVRELYPDLDSVSKALDEYHAEYAFDTLQDILNRLAPPEQKFGWFFEALFRR